MAAVRTSVTELPESRVRVDAEVSADEVERRVQQAARQLGRQMKVPGFRKGKVPPPMVLARVGRGAVLDEAVRDSLPRWYLDAIDDAGVLPVGDPKLDLAELPSEGDSLRFSIEIWVRPPAKLGDYRGLEVGRRAPEVSEEAIDEELERLADRLARLETVEGPAEEGDFVVVDFTATIEGEPLAGGEARDELVELGAERVPDELDRGLIGAAGGESRQIEVAFPDDHGSPELAGRTALFDIAVKEVKRKQLPQLDDDFAADAAGFDTLAQLRADLGAKLEEADRHAIDSEFREAVLDAAVAEARIDLPDALVDARARELWEQLAQTLAQRGISREAYLRISGKGEDQLVSEARPDAERALRREAVLTAVIETEGIDPSEEDLLEALEHSAEHERTTPPKLLARVRESGRLESLRRDVARRQALELLVAEARPIPVEQARARDKLWTPGKGERPQAPQEPAVPAAGRLWTPGS
jgi:trigger factor